MHQLIHVSSDSHFHHLLNPLLKLGVSHKHLCCWQMPFVTASDCILNPRIRDWEICSPGIPLSRLDLQIDCYFSTPNRPKLISCIACRPIQNLHCVPKNVPLHDCLYLRHILTDFQNFFTGAFCGQLAIKLLLNILPNAVLLHYLVKYKCKKN